MNINLPAALPSTTRISLKLITVFVTIFKSKRVSFVLFDKTKKNTTQPNIRIWPYIKIIIMKGPRFNFYWMTVLRGLIAWTLCSTLTPHSIDLRNFYGCQLSPFFYFSVVVWFVPKRFVVVRGPGTEMWYSQPTQGQVCLLFDEFIYIFFSHHFRCGLYEYIYIYILHILRMTFVCCLEEEKKIRNVWPLWKHAKLHRLLPIALL